MKASIWLAFLITFLNTAAFSQDTASSKKTIVEGYELELPDSWIAQKEAKSAQRVVAICKQEGKQVGEILAAPLAESLDKEWPGMIESAEKNPTVIKLLEQADFKTAAGAQGKRILLEIKANDPNYGNPIHFYSIYLPRKNGASITLKLRCGAKNFESLRKEFDQIVDLAKETK